MDLLRIATAGSVDDGKSTLIGRLLYETGSVPKDRLAAVAESSRRRGLDGVDLSLLTDGLMAERAQGITIDVAHVYFATRRRKYIIADVPGHVEYTRNMVTGASTAGLALVLVDAINGPVEQTYRHLFIASLLRIPEIVVCVNKMDLAHWSEQRFADTIADIRKISDRLTLPSGALQVVPLCSLHGDNVVRRSEHMPWYEGPTLLETLERSGGAPAARPARLNVQCVIRASEGRRYAGRLGSGTLRVGDAVVTLPGSTTTRIVGLERGGEPLEVVRAGESVSVRLADALDLGRGGMIASAGHAPVARANVLARLCWLDHGPAAVGHVYLLQHGIRRLRARLSQLVGVIDPQSLCLQDNAGELCLNDIGLARLRLSEPMFADDYATNPANGAFILIDERTNATVAVGFVEAEPGLVDPSAPDF